MKRIDNLTNQFEDLKTAILTSIGSSNEREVARGVVRFRRLVDFLRNLRLTEYGQILNNTLSWNNFLKDVVGIIKIIDLDNIAPNLNRNHLRPRTLLIKEDNTFYEVRYQIDFLNDMALEFEAFINLTSETKNIIFDALNDMRGGLMIVRYHREDFREYLEELKKEYVVSQPLFDDETGEPTK